MEATMLVIFDLLYREYCRARLAEMQKLLLLAGERAKPSKEGHGTADQTHDEKLPATTRLARRRSRRLTAAHPCCRSTRRRKNCGTTPEEAL